MWSWETRTELALRFLEDVQGHEHLAGFERLYLQTDTSDGYSLGDLPRGVRSAIREPGTVYYSPHAFTPRGGRRSDAIVQVASLVIDDDERDLDEAVKHLKVTTGLGAHWGIRTSPGKSQLVLKLRPERLGKRNRAAVLNRIGRIISDLYSVLGADPGAAKVNQPFRLPGSQRDIGDGIWTVSAEHFDHKPYSLRQIESAVTPAKERAKPKPTKQQRPTQRRRTPEKRSYRGYRVTGSGKGAVWNCPAIRWIRDRAIAIGSRDTAATALAIACSLDGVHETTALQRILEWYRSGGTESGPGGDGRPYTEQQIRATVRSIYRHVTEHQPLGLSPSRLTGIVDETGQAMPDGTAQTVLGAMPNARPQHEPRPLEQLRNKPHVLRLTDYLEGLIQHAKQKRTPYLIVTARQGEALTGVSHKTIANRLQPALKAAGIAATIKTRQGTRTSIDLTRLTRARVPPVITFGRPPSDARHERNLLAYLWRRFGSVLSRLWSLLKSLLAWVRSLTSTAVGYVSETVKEVTVPRSAAGRDPPCSSSTISSDGVQP